MANLPLSDLDYYTEIREILGIDETIVSDDAIDRDVVKGQAERELKKAVTDWSTLVNDDAAQLRTAVIYRICSILCDRFRILQPSEEVIGDYEYVLSDTDWTEMAQRFDSLMASAVMNISTYTVSHDGVQVVLATPTTVENIPDWGYI